MKKFLIANFAILTGSMWINIAQAAPLDPDNTQDLYYLCKSYKNSIEKDPVHALIDTNGMSCVNYMKGFIGGFIMGAFSEVKRIEKDGHISPQIADKILDKREIAICPPGNVTNHELIYVFIKYVADHPATFSEDSTIILYDAFNQEFPCSK